MAQMPDRMRKRLEEGFLPLLDELRTERRRDQKPIKIVLLALPILAAVAAIAFIGRELCADKAHYQCVAWFAGCFPFLFLYLGVTARMQANNQQILVIYVAVSLGDLDRFDKALRWLGSVPKYRRFFEDARGLIEK